MHIITQKTLKMAWTKHQSAQIPLRNWYTVMKNSQFENFVALRRRYPSADQVGRLTVFNIGGNKYRLVVRIDYKYQKLFVRQFMTHAEYDKGDWKNDPWF